MQDRKSSPSVTVPQVLRPLPVGTVTLGPGVVQRRYELNRAYLNELRTENLLQNHLFEAGVWGPNSKPEGIHWGWESPTSLVRGFFVGHWMAAAARVSRISHDGVLRAKLDHVVAELGRCQEENGGEWVFSIPEKYLDRIARGRPTWASQYIVQKTFLGLIDTYAHTGNEQALEIAVNAAKWFTRWTRQFSLEEFDGILDAETCAMQESFADLYGITGDDEHLELVHTYERRRLFQMLLAGDDPLTNRHANTTIPEVHGAARAYEVTGDRRWRDIVEAYWECAVTNRDAFATGGQTAGEFWTPPGHLSARLGGKNQEHCTVYNMIRLAEYLLRWTGNAGYGDYIERNRWNGILAQQHPGHGMVTYFLPLEAGARKSWGTRTESFWCCHGTLVQAHANHPQQVLYETDEGIHLDQFVGATATWSWQGTPVRVAVGEGWCGKPDVPGRVDLRLPNGPDARPGFAESYAVVTADGPVDFELSLRVPEWVTGDADVVVGGEVVTSKPEGARLSIRRRWEGETLVEIRLPKTITALPLPDFPETVAFRDGPVLLAGLCGEERRLVGDVGDPASLFTPDNEREFRDWSGRWRTIGQDRGVRFVPLHEVVDEAYTVYFPVAPPAS